MRKLQLNYDVNGKVYGLARYAASSGDVPANPILRANFAPFDTNTDAGSFTETTRFGAVLVVGGQINDMVGVEMGAGLQRYNCDRISYDIENTTYALYLQFPFTVSDSVTITPEIGYMDWGDVETNNIRTLNGIDAKTDHGDTSYFGMYSRINF